MASQSDFIVLTVRTRDVRNHDRLPPVWGSFRLAPIIGYKFGEINAAMLGCLQA